MLTRFRRPSSTSALFTRLKKIFFTPATLMHKAQQQAEPFSMNARNNPHRLFLQGNFVRPNKKNFTDNKALSHTEKKLVIPTLPTLNALYNWSQTLKVGKIPSLDRTIFVCGLHMLNSVVSCFEFLLKLGAKPQHIFIVGKSYSNNKEVIAHLKKMGINVIQTRKQHRLGDFTESYRDDCRDLWDAVSDFLKKHRDKYFDLQVPLCGGDLLGKIPDSVRRMCKSVIAVEQTTSGRETSETIPVSTVQLASSAIKKIEAEMVANVAMDKLSHKLIELTTPGKLSELSDLSYVITKRRIPEYLIKIPAPNERIYGIIGVGYIGNSTLQELIKRGYKKFFIYDKNRSKLEKVRSVLSTKPGVDIVAAETFGNLISCSNIIIGCSGSDTIGSQTDILQQINHAFPAKIFLSLSSGDREFSGLLKYIQSLLKKHSVNPLIDLIMPNGNLILGGGMPFNFTHVYPYSCHERNSTYHFIAPDDRPLESVPASRIQLTRGGIAGAVMQASVMAGQKDLSLGDYQLHPLIQKTIFEAFMEDQGNKDEFQQHQSKLKTPEDFSQHSGATPYHFPWEEKMESKNVSHPSPTFRKK